MVILYEVLDDIDHCCTLFSSPDGQNHIYLNFADPASADSILMKLYQLQN